MTKRCFFSLAGAVALAIVVLLSNANAAEEPIRLEINYAEKGDSAEWSTVVVPGTDVKLTARVLDEVWSGYTSQGLPSLYVTIVPDTEAADMVFSQVIKADFWAKPVPSKGPNAFKVHYRQTGREFEADARGGKIIFLLPSTPKPDSIQEFEIPDWEWPEPETPPFHDTPESPVGLTPPAIADGDYLVLKWRGSVTEDGVPWVDPRYPISWEQVANPVVQFSLVFYQWELWGTERTPGLTTGTDQPSVPLGHAADADTTTLGSEMNRLRLPPVGEVTLGFLHKGIAQIQAGYWPRINVAANSRHPHSALLSRKGGEWVWTFD